MADTEQPTGTQSDGGDRADPYSRSCPHAACSSRSATCGPCSSSGRFTKRASRNDSRDIDPRRRYLHQDAHPDPQGLERDGLIERHQYPEIPPRVTYELTDSGRGLAEALAHVEAWATEHLGAVSQARARYDAEH